MKLRYHPAAESELREATHRYNEEVEGLGYRFLDQVRVSAEFMRIFPRAAPEIDPTIRRQLLDRFPYSLFYSIEESELFVLAVAHHSQRPGYWLSRLGGDREPGRG